MAAQTNRARTAIFDPPLVTIEASAVQHCRRISSARSGWWVRHAYRSAQERKRVLWHSATHSEKIPLRSSLAIQTLRDRSGAVAFGLPDRRRVGLATMRLWRSIETVACAPRRSRRWRHPLPCAGGSRARPRQQAADLSIQEAGLDTVDAGTALGFDDDQRDYGVAARMLGMLRIQRIVLLTNNPSKLDGLARSGIEIIGRLPVEAP